MPTLKLNGKDVEFEAGMTVLQVCEQQGIEIPRFCYHERLEIAGNCRMCLVEVKPGPPKPQASCALPAGDGMEVTTDSPMVHKARQGVMEFLLINHPLDCPICDQGGECDLQDQAVAYGKGTSRYREHKRAVEEKYMGPLIKTEMTRCIHCTRCIRFVEDVAGVPELGATGRGEHMEVTTYVEKALTSELSGNIIDLCPVGALTSRPYAFHARPWELAKTESIDVLDALGSNIRVDTRGNAVLRILPRLNEEINEEWLSDKGRYACDGLRYQRLDRPYIRKDGKLVPASWDKALETVAARLKSTDAKNIAAIAGDLACVESMKALKDLLEGLGCANIDCRQDGMQVDAAERADYLFNTSIEGIEQADILMLIGTNPRHEAPVLNARIRKAFLRGTLKKIYAIGEPVPLTYPVEWLGNNPALLSEIARGEHAVCEQFGQAGHPALILGSGALARGDGAEIHAAARQFAANFGLLKEDWNGFNVLHRAASRVGGMDVGFVPQDGGRDVKAIIEGTHSGDIELLYLLGADELDMSQIGDEAFIVYQGHHGDAGAHKADVILPGAAYTEKDATYVNTEGRVQQTRRAVFPPGEAREDWKILRALSAAIGRPLPFDSLAELQALIARQVIHFSQDGAVASVPLNVSKQRKAFKIDSIPFSYPIDNYHMTDPISRVSKTMAECVSVRNGKRNSEQEAA